LTAAFIFLVQYSDGVKIFIMASPAIMIISCIGSIVLMFMIICCFGRQHPTNLILLGLFTLCETWMIGSITIGYTKEIVAVAGLVTALVTVSLTAYAFKTKV